MEPGTVVGIAIALAYFVIQALSRRKRAPQQQQPQRQKRPVSQDSQDLGEALREIRRALGWPDEETARTPPAEERAASRPMQTQEPPRPSEKARRPAERPQTPPPRPAREKATRRKMPQPPPARRGAERPLKPRPLPPLPPSPRPIEPAWDSAGYHREELFESGGPTELETRRRAPDESTPQPQVPELVARIRNPASLRQEFLIKEILDPPLALRRRRL